jgi:HEAT repeat protein
MNLIDIVLFVSFILTILSLLLLLIIIGLRIFTDRSLQQEIRFRKRVTPVLKRYIQGDATLEESIVVLKSDQRLGLQLLKEESDLLGTEGITKLHPLFASFEMTGQELHTLKSKSWQKRLHAAEHLGYYGDNASIPALMNALGDDIVDVRFAAARSLCQLACTDAVGPIMSSLNVPGEVSQRRVAEILLILGLGAREQILEIIRTSAHNDPSLSIAIRLSGMLQIKQAVLPLQNLLTNQFPNIRLNAVRSLASIGDPSSIPSIASLSDDSSWEVRSSVMAALGRLHATAQIPLLLLGLADQEWWVRHHAGTSLIELGDQGIKELRAAADHHDDAYGRDMSRQILQEKGLLTATTEVHS